MRSIIDTSPEEIVNKLHLQAKLLLVRYVCFLTYMVYNAIISAIHYSFPQMYIERPF